LVIWFNLSTSYSLWSLLFSKYSKIDCAAGLNSLLFEKAFYFRDSLLMRAQATDAAYGGDNRLRTKKGTPYKNSILEHILIQHLISFFNIGPHNTIRLENADWNDGLDMAAEVQQQATAGTHYTSFPGIFHTGLDFRGVYKAVRIFRRQPAVSSPDDALYRPILSDPQIFSVFQIIAHFIPLILYYVLHFPSE